MVIVVVEGIDQGCTTSTVHSNCTVVNKKPWTAMQRKEEMCLFLNRKVLSSFSKRWTEWMRALYHT